MLMSQDDEWKNKPHRYLITLRSGKQHTTGVFDTFADLERWLHSGVAGIVTRTDHFRIFPADVEQVQYIEE